MLSFRRQHFFCTFAAVFQAFGRDYQFEVVETIEAPTKESLIYLLNQRETELITSYRSWQEKYGYNKRIEGTEHLHVQSDDQSILLNYFWNICNHSEFTKTVVDLSNSIQEKV